MKKYVVRYAFATNLIEHLSGAEPNLPIADCSKLPLGDQIADHVLLKMACLKASTKNQRRKKRQAI